jgi:hypothetical protein
VRLGIYSVNWAVGEQIDGKEFGER